VKKKMKKLKSKVKKKLKLMNVKKYGGNKGDVPAAKRGDKKDTAEEEGVEDYKKKVKEMKHELDEAYATHYLLIKKRINEVKLFQC
jgi:aminoglycoside phosphotransferase family enzyme